MKLTDILTDEMLSNNPAMCEGRFENSNVIWVEMFDYVYLLDVSFTDGVPTVHDYRSTSYSVNEVTMEIFDYPDGAAYDEMRYQLEMIQCKVNRDDDNGE